MLILKGFISELSKAAQLKGGNAEGMKDSDFNQAQLRAGTQVEREHSTNLTIRKQIAKDHLKEFPTYYKWLKKMEGWARKDQRAEPVKGKTSASGIRG